MLNVDDKQKLVQRGISEEEFEAQLMQFQTGFPYMKVEKPAIVSDGILCLDDKSKSFYLSEWSEYLKHNNSVVKFVPASGAASRMFKSLFEFVSAGKNELIKDNDKLFFGQIEQFAFYDELNFYCKRNEGWDIPHLIADKKYLRILESLLEKKGMNYGFLPKGLLAFHKYQGKKARTPFEEHLVEGALYAKNSKGKVSLHFTVSKEHIDYFEKLLKSRIDDFSYQFGADFDVTFSVQKPSTDTVAVDMDNHPFRENGEILFRPGGHGALIENLNAIDSDVIFIKNIDNVAPDAYKQPTVEYKMVLAGLLVNVQKTIFEYQAILDSDSRISEDTMKKMFAFAEKTLCVTNKYNPLSTNKDKVDYLKMIYNRPLRVCGMVKNEGEPGGGPYLCQNPNGTVSCQILESCQFDMNDESQVEIMKSSTHFNPVDLVCAVKNYKGDKYNLLSFVDENTGFISYKSKNGRELKALERPGLWNGSMSDWNTIFVEVPIDTFTPVKMVTDLLRPEHQ
ncbi:MAG: DUF4301 family protein [Paludibacteraceae bacterium]|nr:DUF4301 family protein [Paludibacteraceae bacterium]MBR5971652.1 DUF4301 family protein [Paludibacteraceae bacterium]